MKKTKFHFLFILVVITLSGCASDTPNSDAALAAADSAILHPQNALTPRGRTLDPNSPAIIHALLQGKAGQKSGLKPNDHILNLNGKKINSIAEYDVATKFAPKNSTLLIDRSGVKKSFQIAFNDDRPKGGIEIEPLGFPVIRAGTPLISTIHTRDFTVHAQASVNAERDELHVNFIIESNELLPTALAKFVVYDLKSKKVLLNDQENLDALGSKPLFLAKKMSTHSDFDSPIRVALNLLNDHFVFEFQ
jgi:membrane-associated protease RseP (regulator of RpoE activity)